ncbi:MAG: hypothetical protein IK078_11185 [Lachnospiraceae bacterium]|nr:hypothetical protein [Lachnospiraceae bacterium]
MTFYDETQKTDPADVAGKPEAGNEQWQSKFLQKKRDPETTRNFKEAGGWMNRIVTGTS